MSYSRSVSHSEEFDSPASSLWDLLMDWGSIVDWMPHGIISDLDIEGSGVGAVRHMVTRQGERIVERLERADERQGRLELSILDPLPWSMLSYKACAQLDQLGPEKCNLRWEGTFELPENGQAADALGQFFNEAYKTMFKGIRQQLSVGTMPTPCRHGDG